jgi:hypothetical protein
MQNNRAFRIAPNHHHPAIEREYLPLLVTEKNADLWHRLDACRKSDTPALAKAMRDERF